MDVKNGLVAIAGEVLGDVQKEAEALILGAEKEAKKTLRAAKSQADQDYQTFVGQAKVKAEAEQRRIASLTEVEIRNRLLNAKEELVDKAFETAVCKLIDFVETPKYHDYLLRLIEEAAEKVGSKNLILQANAKDKEWLTQEHLQSLCKKLHIEIKLSEEPEICIGGCKVQSEDGKVTYDNTIDSRLQELKPTLRTEVAKIMFEEET
jgi:V/A-type H+/Na+-transporting ATPase subunit E